MVNGNNYLSITGTFQKPTLSFKITSKFVHSDTPIAWVTSGSIQCSKISCELQGYLNDKTHFLQSKLIFGNLNDNKEVFTKSALILVDYKLKRNNNTLGVKENVIFKIFPSKTVFELDPFYMGSFSNMPTTYLDISLKFIQIFDYSSTLFFCLGPPSKAPYFHFLNSKDISNASFKLQIRDQIIWVNKQVICKECPFFEKMLQKEWMKNSNEDDELHPVKIANWSDNVLIAIILHLYTGWLPGTQICEEVYKKLHIEASDFAFDRNLWLELYETADMIELSTLAMFAAIEAKKCSSSKIDDVLKTFFFQE